MRVVYTILILVALSSCKSAQWHIGKAIDKGAVFNDKTVEVEIHDTINVMGKDSIITRNIEIPCPELEAPKTKWMVRFDNKRFKDSLKFVKKMYSDSLDYELKSLRSNNKMLSDSLVQARKVRKYEENTDKAGIKAAKKSRWLLWMILGGVITLVLVYLFNRFKKLIFPEN